MLSFDHVQPAFFEFLYCINLSVFRFIASVFMRVISFSFELSSSSNFLFNSKVYCQVIAYRL